MSDVSISWRGVFDLCPKFILVVKVILGIILLDLIISISLSAFVSESFYLKQFLADDYEKVTNDYYNHRYFIEPNKAAGWANTPNLRQEGDLWHTDSLGSRISPMQSDADARHVMLTDGSNLTFILGSSVLNGFTLDYEKTPDSYLNAYGYHAFNFASALYTIDQSYGLYESVLSQYKPSTLIIGIHNDADVISNMFAAFRDVGDKNSPFLKPAYHLSDGKLVKTLPPYEHHLSNEWSLMLADLKKNDADYYKFEYFRRLSLLPFSDLLRQLILKFSRKFFNVDGYIKDVELQKALMAAIVELAEESGTNVIFVKLEGLYDQEQPFYNRLFYQFLHPDKNALHNKLLKEATFNIVYTSELFKKSGEPISKFYLDDELHLSADGSALLAAKLDQEMKRLHEKN